MMFCDDFELFWRRHEMAVDTTNAALELMSAVSPDLYGEPLENPALETFRRKLQRAYEAHCLPYKEPSAVAPPAPKPKPRLQVVQ